MENEILSSDHIANGNGPEQFQKGLVFLASKDFSQSYLHLKLAESEFAKKDDSASQVHTLNKLGEVSRNLMRYQQAIHHWKQALAVLDSYTDDMVKGDITLNLGRLYLKVGEYSLARDYLEQTNRLFRSVNHHPGIGCVNTSLGLLHHQIDDDETALEFTRLALRTTQEIGDHSTHADALTFQGHAMVRLNLLDNAQGAYQYALNLFDESKNINRMIDVKAGMARLMYAIGSKQRSSEIVDELLVSLNCTELEEVVEPVRAMLTCYTALSSTHDYRAKEMLLKAYTWLIMKAEQLQDAGMQRSYLENIAAHRIVLQIWMDKNNK